MEIDWVSGLDWRLQRIARCSRPNDRKILFVVLDGLGGLPHPDFCAHGPYDAAGEKTPKSELEWASLGDKVHKFGNLDHLNTFVRDPKTVTGRIYPVGRGYTPNSVDGHLGLFGYDPEHYFAKRGPTEAAALPGLCQPGDVIARFNFCRVENGKIVDRRAGRMKDRGRGRKLADAINAALKEIRGAHVQVEATAEHRGVLILRRTEKSDPPLSEHISDTDPGVEGKPPLDPDAISLINKPAVRTATLVKEALALIEEVLTGNDDANMIILRGFGTMPELPHFTDVYNVQAAAIAAYPVYRGVGHLLGMAVLNGRSDSSALNMGQGFGPEIDVLKENYKRFDFFFLHYKKPDEKGEDGDFEGKVKALCDFDAKFSRIRDEFDFDVIVVTGDHSTPSLLKSHSHHSVPLAVYSNVMKGYERTLDFTEPSCVKGNFGSIYGPDLMAVVLANAGKLPKRPG